jgi:molybdopterin-guanine dinucleotide biosynthesis protein A
MTDTTARSLDVTGLLLVGGLSTRFGSAKTLARFDGETLAERAWRLLAQCCERLAVGKRADGLELPFEIVDDGTDIRAPLAGLVAGLRAATQDVSVVIPVDCPFLTLDGLRRLALACVGDAAVSSSGPLPGAYRKSALGVLDRRLLTNDLSLRGALAQLEVARVELPASALLNVNYRSDLPEGPPFGF